MANYVFIATSLDGYIARPDGSIDWLTGGDIQSEGDYGYSEFTEHIDAIVLGRGTYDVVSKFTPWPYSKPVFVVSNTRKRGKSVDGNIEIIGGEPDDIVRTLNERGYRDLYIDGGKTIQGFLAKGLIDEMTITRIPILLGSGIPLFGTLSADVRLTHLETVTYRNGLVKSRYRIIK